MKESSWYWVWLTGSSALLTVCLHRLIGFGWVGILLLIASLIAIALWLIKPFAIKLAQNLAFEGERGDYKNDRFSYPYGGYRRNSDEQWGEPRDSVEYSDSL